MMVDGRILWDCGRLLFSLASSKPKCSSSASHVNPLLFSLIPRQLIAPNKTQGRGILLSPNSKRKNRRNADTNSVSSFGRSDCCTLRLESQDLRTVISSPSLYMSEWHCWLTRVSYSGIYPETSELHWNANLLCNGWDEKLTFAGAKINIYILERAAPEVEACGVFCSNGVQLFIWIQDIHACSRGKSLVIDKPHTDE